MNTKLPDPRAIMGSFAADHDVTDTGAFCDAVRTAVARPFSRTKPVTVELAPRTKFTVIGEPHGRTDALAAVTGRKKFTMDLDVPDGHLHHVVARRASVHRLQAGVEEPAHHLGERHRPFEHGPGRLDVERRLVGQGVLCAGHRDHRAHGLTGDDRRREGYPTDMSQQTSHEDTTGPGAAELGDDDVFDSCFYSY